MTPLRWLTAPYAAILCANPNDLQVCSKLKMCRDRCQSSCVHNFHLCIEFSLVSNNCTSRLSFRATIDGSPLSDLRDRKLVSKIDSHLFKTCGLRHVSLHHHFSITGPSNIRIFEEKLADLTRQTYGDIRFDKSTIRHQIFEYSDLTESKCHSLAWNSLCLFLIEES